MRLLQSIRTITLGLALVTTFPAAAQSTSLDSLPTATQDEISRICLPVQFREGAGAYRNCVQAELSARANSSASELGKLSFDDKYAVQQACAKAGGQSSANYQSCVADQISALNRIAAPALEKLSEDELYVVQQSCFDAQSKQGAASYRTCLNGEVESLLAIPAADTSNLNMLKKNALQLRCSSNSSTAVQYRQCVAAEYESIAGTAPSFLPVSTADTVQNASTENASPSVDAKKVEVAAVKAVTPEPKPEPTIVATEVSKPTMALPRNIKPPQSNAGSAVEQAAIVTASNTASINQVAVQESVQQEQATSTLQDPTGDSFIANASTTIDAVAPADARVISKPGLIETIELQERAKAQGIELEPAAIDATQTTDGSPTAMIAGAWQKFLDTIATMDSAAWLVIAGILATPALCLGLFSVARRFKRADMPAHNPALTDRIEPGMQTRKARHEKEAAALFDDDYTANEPLDLSPAQNTEHDAVTRMATKSERPDLYKPNREPQQPNVAAAAPSAIEAAMAATNTGNHAGHPWQSAFGQWLMQRPEEIRMESCIEFLIYWVAYGDDRYQPELKKRLFTAKKLSSHDQIKRWVLKQDVYAFSDVVGWLRNNASQKQLDQSIALIMALLVTEHNVTPVQNTLLRFLSDAFNIGKDRLEQRFIKAFGHPLPPVPRTDKYAWWTKQGSEALQQWDARAMALKPETEQMIARLGLAANYDESQIINAFRRAARRCHPDRFSELGERERALAEQQFIKFEQARDRLLGVSV